MLAASPYHTSFAAQDQGWAHQVIEGNPDILSCNGHPMVGLEQHSLLPHHSCAQQNQDSSSQCWADISSASQAPGGCLCSSDGTSIIGAIGMAGVVDIWSIPPTDTTRKHACTCTCMHSQSDIPLGIGPSGSEAKVTCHTVASLTGIHVQIQARVIRNLLPKAQSSLRHKLFCATKGSCAMDRLSAIKLFSPILAP